MKSTNDGKIPPVSVAVEPTGTEANTPLPEVGVNDDISDIKEDGAAGPVKSMVPQVDVRPRPPLNTGTGRIGGSSSGDIDTSARLNL